MKKIIYENGPDEIRVGPKNAQVLLKRGVPSEDLDDAFADSLLKKPMFKEAAEKKAKTKAAID